MTKEPQQSKLKPMGFGVSLLYFGIPALIFVLGFWVLMPALIGVGWLPYYAYIAAIGLPLVLMFIAAILHLQVEGMPLSWSHLKSRYRIEPLDRAQWLWIVGVVVICGILGTALMSQLSGVLIENGLIPIPESLPAFLRPLSSDALQAYDAAVGGLANNWWPFLALFVVLFFNIFGEELWWRGVVLPRQEIAFGRWAWLIHGLMWNLFHVFKWWDLLNLLPITLGLSYLAYRYKNTTPGIVIHYIVNGIGLIPLALGALGLFS
jgi:membrane protease YdiL (CAAX protease family)